MHKTTIPLLLTGLLLSGSAAQAQTALIAHRSHGGTARTFRPAAAGADNFGRLLPSYEPEKIVWLDKSRALYHMRLVRPYGRQNMPKTRLDTMDVRQDTGKQELDLVLERLRQQYPQARLVGFDSPKARASWPKAEPVH